MRKQIYSQAQSVGWQTRSSGRAQSNQARCPHNPVSFQGREWQGQGSGMLGEMFKQCSCS